MAGRVRGRAGALLGVPGRVLSVLDGVEDAVDRIDRLLDLVTTVAARADAISTTAVAVVDRADAVAGRVAGIVDRADEVAGRAVGLVDQAAAVAGRVAGVVDRADAVAGRAAGVVSGAGQTERSAAELVSAYEPVLTGLRPALTRLAETVDPQEVEAMVALVDRLPALLDSVDTDVLPLLGRLNEIAPDLHALLEAVDDLRSAVAGVPGIGRLMRRGDDQVADPDARPGDDPHGATRAIP